MRSSEVKLINVRCIRKAHKQLTSGQVEWVLGRYQIMGPVKKDFRLR